VPLGGTNTVVLIVSSLTMVLAVSATQRGERDKAFVYLAATFVLACCFLVVKYFEYSHKIHDGLLPAGFFRHEELLKVQPKAGLFFSLYFIMTGIHAAHVIIGMGLIAWVMKRTRNREFSPAYFTPVEIVGLYWHFVDLVWIYLFPLLYLVG
jgi:cytochrome c oxidase subunit 3